MTKDFNYKDTILDLLRSGNSTEDIAEMFSDALNTAEKERKEEIKKEEEKQNLQEVKRSAAYNIITAVNDYFMIVKNKELISRDELSDEFLDMLVRAFDALDVEISPKGFGYGFFNPLEFMKLFDI